MFYPRKTLKVALSALLLITVAFGITWAASTAAKASSATPLLQTRQVNGALPVVRYSLKNDLSPALREQAGFLPPAAKDSQKREILTRPLPGQAALSGNGPILPVEDPVLQNWAGDIEMPAPVFNFEGLSNNDNNNTIGFFLAPPDTMGSVGYDPASGKKYYVQWVNLVFAIWDVTGAPTLVYGPAAGNSLWAGFGGICESNNDGDVLVLFDELSNRWLMSQFALFGSDGHHQCVAISQTANPLGGWYRYDFLASATKINDYPKIGVWPDGFYVTANQFDGSTFAWAGTGVWAYERDQMLLGLPARQIYFDLYDTDPNLGGMLPSDLDGTPPPAGTPNYFAVFNDDASGYSPQDELQIWGFAADWATPSNSTFTKLITLATAPFDAEICTAFRGACIDQPNGNKLEDLADRLMYRLQYRNFGDHQAMVVNHSIDVTGSTDNGQAGVRWYELRETGSGWNIYQQGTYAPDSDHRWMGSIAMDRAGNIALGYSVSSASTYPSIRYTGRLLGDPLNTFPQAETELIAGSYSQEGTARWGDYSMMALDPTDDCTFWYTQEYVSGPNIIGWGNWSTRIGSFKYPTCTSGPAGNLHGTVTDSSSGLPVANALVDLGNGIMTFTDPLGFYQVVNLPVGTYDVTVSTYGYLPKTVTGVSISDGITTPLDFALDPAPVVTVDGVVTDVGHGWPLYARIHISTFGHEETIFTNPVSGAYSLPLLQDTAYTFEVSAIVDGYFGESRPVTPPAGGSTENFALVADPIMCAAPGYIPEFVYQFDFEANDGNFIASGSNSTWEWGTPTSGPGEAHSGSNVWATNLSGNYVDNEHSEIASPDIDLSAYADRSTIILSWWQWLQTEECCDSGSVDVSNDGGSSWTTFFGPAFGDVSLQWTQYTIYLDPSYAVSNFRIRFRLDTDGSVIYPGFYVDDLTLAVPPAPITLYNEDFESDNGGYAISGTTSWEWGTPTRGPGSAHSGTSAWATDLDGNYGNNENGYITSPVIDLSSRAGEPLLLSWWQWLQTEANYDYASVEISSDSGANWSVIFYTSGTVDTQWNQYVFWLDPAYSTSGFRVRFGLVTDGVVSYPGFYVDDVAVTVPEFGPPMPPCIPQPGGLVVGQVFDANTSSGLNGALVSDATGGSTLSFPVPDDPAVGDGFYALFAANGAHDLTASKSNYGSDTHSVSVPLGDTLLQNFSLGAGFITSTPDSLEVTMTLGTSDTLPLTLTNEGGVAASFEITEQDGGMIPANRQGAPIHHRSGNFTPYRLTAPLASAAYPGTERPIPIHSPPWTDIASYPSAIMDNTAAELNGLVYSVAGFDGGSNISSGYVYDPAIDAWSPIASMSNAREKPAAAFVGELLYVVGGWDNFGGTVAVLEIYDPATDTWSSGSPVPAAYAAATGVGLEGQFYVIGGCTGGCGSTDVFRYDPALDSWTSLAPYPELVSWNACGAIDGLIYCAGGVSDSGETNNTYVYDPVADSWTQLADVPQTQWGMGFTAANGRLYISGGVTDNFSTITNETFAYDPASDTWSPDANSNNVVYRGASACGFYKIGGSIGGFNPVPNAELYPGLTTCAAAGDVPWLSTSPISGTLSSSGGTQLIDVTFDASVPEVNQPGQYLAQLKVKEDTPYSVAPIPVTMNITPPPTWGNLTGTVAGLARCDGPSAPLSGATVEISGIATTFTNASGLYSYWLEEGDYTLFIYTEGYAEQTLNVSVAAGETLTNDFDLRLDAPCGIVEPPQIDVTLLAGASTSTTLVLDNNGFASLAFDILEAPYSLPAFTFAPQDRQYTYNQPDQSGPASILTMTRQTTLSGLVPEAPDSGWFGGLAIPGGIVRYAHAQCYEQPGSFYVISGIDGGFNASSKTWRYDAGSNTWTQLASIPAGSEGPTAVCYLGKIYVLGGNGSNQFYIYDIAMDSWSAAAPLPRGVAGAAVGAWDGKIFLIGGDDDFYPASGVSDQVDIYDIASDTWIGTGTPMPVGTSFPGFAQAGPYLYAVGGWGALAPGTNVNATLRYDMATDTWETGPEYTSAHSDFALALTSQALYAIAGDSDGGGFFDATDTVERLDLSAWPAGAWTDINDPLPVALTSNNAGFCAEIFSSAAIWSVGGANLNTFGIGDANLFRSAGSEECYTIYGDVSWLTKAPTAGNLAGDSDMDITVNLDSQGLPVGIYYATLVFRTNDPAAPLIRVPVRMIVATFDVELAPAVEVGYGGPGYMVEHHLTITNMGTTTDTFDLTFAGNDPDWVVSLPATSVTLASGESTVVIIYVTLPLDALAGESDSVTITATSQGDPSKSASAILITRTINFYFPVIRR